MPGLLASLGSAIAGNALKWGLGLMLLAAVGGGGFVWGESHAAAIVAAAAARDAEARVAAAQKSDVAMLGGYLNKLTVQTARGDALSAALAANESKLAAATQAAKETIAHAVAKNSSCDLSADAVSLLNAQPARR